MEVIRTIEAPVRLKYPVGKCRFFASVSPCQTEEEAQSFIAAVSLEFRDASHNAWGFKLSSGDGLLAKSSDDREPSNSAGPPILQAIEGAEVTNCVVVVTRYYGGVNLGVGGLIRAYRGCAAAGLAEATIKEIEVRVPVVISRVSYPILGSLMHELEGVKAQVTAVDYGTDVTVRAAIFAADFDLLEIKVRDLTRGQGVIAHE